MKLRAQIFHSHLLLYAHISSMLQACGEPANRNHHNHLPSRNICVEASRELLRRFVKLRSCDHTASYFRLLDRYIGLATATLLLTRLNGHYTSGVPDPQHASDRAIVSNAMEKMRLVEDDGSENIRDASSTHVLCRLLAIEAAGASVVMTCRKP